MISSASVQPSAVVRFAKHFGFSGYTELQKVFRDGLSHRLAPDHNYQARIRDVIHALLSARQLESVAVAIVIKRAKSS